MSKTERLYQLERPPFTSREFHTKFTHLAGPLSLFEPEDNTDVGNENPEVERPLTPIEDAVKCPPSSFSALAKIVRPRLLPKDGIHGLSSNDQQQLIEILMNELNNIWRDVQRGPPDPFLTGQQNRELQRRLTIEIVVITQGLFAKYLDKANKLNQRGVFSGPANLSRLKTQLALEASKILNVLSIKRNLAADMKHPLDTSTVSSKFSFSRALRTPPPKHYRPLVMRQDEDKKNKGHLSREEKRQLLIDRELSDLQKKMPQVDSSYYHTIVPHHLQLPKKSASDSGSVIEDDISQQRNGDEGIIHSIQQVTSRHDEEIITFLESMILSASRGPSCVSHFLQEYHDGYTWKSSHSSEKYASLPELFSRDAVFEELGILPEEMQDYLMRRSQSETQLMEENKVHERDVERTSVTKPGTADRASQDLMKLILSPSKPTEKLQGEEDIDDLPPLLQALARHSSTNKQRDTRKQRRLQTEAGSKDEEDDAASATSSIRSTEASSIANDPTVMDDNITEFTGEEHPQPAVVSLRLPDKTVVRASDVRVSNRVNKESVTLKRYPTVYNDLTGEIDAPMVKWLDRNLFIGEEIKEVYEEIIKTIGTDHLLFDQDTYVERHAASTAEVSLCTSSSSLDKPRAARLINKHLKKEIPPPWGNSTADNWRNSPKFGGLGREDILQAKLKKGDDNGHGNKSYNSWLAWWRSTITTDDFFKFLSTQENDYMSLLFHLYDSDNEDGGEGDGNEDRPNTLQMALIRERERKRAELKSLKSEYKPGVWNVNSVLLGGLGNEPDVNDEELMANLEDTYLPVPSTVTPSKQQTVVVGSPLAHSASSVQSSGSTTTVNSDQHKLEATLKVNSVGFATQASITARGESASSSEAGLLSPQERLERIWMLLCMPDAKRLDMAIKYSAEPYSTRLIESLASWEVATEVILERESLMTKLEDFERTASDPNRFFVKGIIGSSAERIRESKTRDSFNKRLSQIDSDVRRAVTDVQSQFGDIVTFQGRPYLEKMSLDRTEMFYWLQQERRQQVMEKELVKMREVTLNSPDLPPIPAHTIL